MEKQTPKFAFAKSNYIIMLAGIAVIILGFVIMSLETGEYGFGTLGLTLGPIVLLLGFVVQFFAIFYKQSSKK
jgi:ATP/ADP translocase